MAALGRTSPEAAVREAVFWARMLDDSNHHSIIKLDRGELVSLLLGFLWQGILFPTEEGVRGNAFQ
jgi:hypothetical protein